MAEGTAGASETWARLDAATASALRLGWEAFQTGNIGVGAPSPS